MGDVIEFFRSQYDSTHVQCAQVSERHVKLEDRRRKSHVLIPNDKWKDCEEYMLRFLKHFGLYSDVCGRYDPSPYSLTLEDMNSKHHLTPDLVMTMMWYGDRGHKALDVRRFEVDKHSSYASKDGVRLSMSAVCSLYARRWQIRRDIYVHADMATVRDMITPKDHFVVQAQTEWLTQQHRKGCSRTCEGCEQEQGNQLAHACVMEHTPERLEESFDFYYDNRPYEAIARLYETATGTPLTDYPAALDPRQALYKVLTKRYFVWGPPDEPVVIA